MDQPKCLVLVHLYYPELWDEIAAGLRELWPARCDLLVNVVAGRATNEWQSSMSREFDGSRVFVSPNLGQDVGGTLNLLWQVDLDRYDLVCKLHTKKCEHSPGEGARWRRDLLRACLEDVDEIFEVFASRPEVTMLGSAERVMVGSGRNQRACERLCNRMKLDRRYVNSPWVAGCMFWCRPYVMQALKDAALTQSEFPTGYGLDGTLAHAVERVFGALAASRGSIHWRMPRARTPGIGASRPAPQHAGMRPVSGDAPRRRLNWFFCLNDQEPRFAQCAKAAVVSAAPYSLNKFCVYDGQDEHLVAWLGKHNVQVIRRRFSLADELLKAGAGSPGIGLGAFLRIDVPELARAYDLLDSPRYLYTDCDVMFQNDPSWLLDAQTDTFCAAIELHESESHFNTGVMWCNADFFARSLDEFRRFLVAKRFDFIAFDQGALNEFYGSSRQVLGREYNWKPHWGVDENAVIVHFHGPKPWEFRLWECDSQGFRTIRPSLAPFLRSHTRAAYEHYVARFDDYLARADGRMPAMPLFSVGFPQARHALGAP